MRSLATGLFVLPLIVLVACGTAGTAAPGTGDAPAAPSPPSDGAPPSGPSTTPPPGDEDDAGAPDAPTAKPEPTVVWSVSTMTFGGDGRVVGLAVPKEIPQGKTVALVLAFHGDGGNGPALHDVLDIPSFSKGEAVVAYPTSAEFGWDLTLPGTANKDIPWVEALVASLAQTYPIDAKRVFAAGFSKGAFFSDQLACSKSGFLRGVSVHSGGAPYDPDGKVGRYPNGYVQCDPTETGVAALVIHGESDGTVAFGSGEYATKYWSYVNGCSGDQTPWSVDPSCQAEVACPDALPVTFCPIPGLDHAVWPKAAEVTWAFFAGL